MLITSKKIFYINSRNGNGTDSDFTYTLDLPENNGFNKVVVLQMQIPKSYYQIQSGQNTFTLTENGIDYTITVPQGSYSRRSLQATLQNLLTSVGSYTYTVSYPSTTTAADTAKYTFTVSGNSSNQPTFKFGSNNIAEAMGFNRNTSYTFENDILTSANVINLQKESTLFLHSDICSNSTDNVLQEVYVSAGDASYSNILYQCIDIEAYSKDLSTKGSNTFRFHLTDEDGNTIDLQGQNILITLMLYKSNNALQALKAYLKLSLLEK